MQSIIVCDVSIAAEAENVHLDHLKQIILLLEVCNKCRGECMSVKEWILISFIHRIEYHLFLQLFKMHLISG